jgi:outer membrane autotransporter protein
LARNDINFATVAATPNRKGAATGIEGTGFGNPLYDAVVKLTAADARVAFDQTSDEYHASQQTARVEDSRYIREAMNQRLRNGDNDPEADKIGHLTAWAHGWGHWGTVDSDGNAAKLSDNGDGLLIGADMPVGAARVGVTGGASRNSLSVNDRNSWGRETSTWLGAFAGIDMNAFSLRGGLAYAWDRIPTNREVNFLGYSDRLSGNASGDTLTGFIEGAWTFKFGQSEITPFLNVAHTKVETDASTEAGGAAALHAFDATTNVSFSTLGARGAIDFAHNLNLHGELGWQHAFGDTTPEANLQFAAGGPAFTEYGVPIAKNAGLGRIGVGWRQGNIALNADYEGLAGNGVKDQAAKVSVSITF